MFLRRHKHDRLGERVEFKFSNFQAFKVPMGCDRLRLSILSVETGKAITKSIKTTVYSGTCQWKETLSEFVMIPRNDLSKELEECLFKIVVYLGSHRSGALGEVILNLTEYISPHNSGLLHLPLQKCNHGTLLQVRIQCLKPKSMFSDEKPSNETSSHPEGLHTKNDELDDSKSDISDNMFNPSVGSFLSGHLGVTCPNEPVNQVRIQCLNPKSKFSDEKPSKETSSHPEGLHSKNDELDDSKSDISDSMFNPSVGSFLSGHLGVTCPNEPVNQDASCLQLEPQLSSKSRDGSIGRSNFSPRNVSNGAGAELSRSNPSSFNSRISNSSTPNRCQESIPRTSLHGFSPVSFRPSSSPKDFLEAAEETIEDLKDEAKMWERHAQKLKIDVQKLKKELFDKSKHMAELDTELSAAYFERDSLKQEVEQLKSSLKEKMTKQTANETAKFEDMLQVQKELADEVKFQKESIANLSCQLEKAQEENIKFASIIEEQEGTIKKLRLQMNNNLQENLVSETEGHMKSPMLSSIEEEWASKLSAKEEEIIKLEEKVAGMLIAQQPNEVVSDQGHHDLVEEIEGLRAKLKELENDCAELTDENLELLYKIKISGKDTIEARDNEDFGSEFGLLRSQICELEEELRRKEMLKEGLTETLNFQIKNLEKKCSDFELELLYFKDQACDLSMKLGKSQADVDEKTLQVTELQQKLKNFKVTDLDELKVLYSLKEREVDVLNHTKEELEDQVMDIQREKYQLEENLASVVMESNKTSKCFEDAKHELMLLSRTVDTHVSTNKILERKLMELESCKHELETHISEVEEENIQLNEHISGLEAQLSRLTNEKESSRVELEDSKSLVTDLENEVAKHQAEMEIQKGELQQKLQEAQEEIECLKRSLSNLQSTGESLIEENSSLQNLNGDLQRQKLEMYERSAHLEVKLSESRKLNSEFLTEVEGLELKISSLQKDISSKERSLASQIVCIFQEHKEQEEKISKARFMLNQIDLEKTDEVENLKREVEAISLQASAIQDERDRMASAALQEISDLRSDKSRLESSLQEAHAKVHLLENNLQTLRQETGKVQELVDLLNASKQREEMLISGKEHMKRQIVAAKCSEEKCKRTVSELELKLKAADYGKQQLIEETSGMKVQLQRLTHLQDEILALKSSLEDAKLERAELEESLMLVSGECEYLKTERILLEEKISNMQKALHDGEDDRRNMIALEEKVLRLEGDVIAKEASYAREAELKREVNRTKLANNEYRRKIQCLEEEQDELVGKAELLEKELFLLQEDIQNKKFSSKDDSRLLDMEAEIQELHGRIHILETEHAEAQERNNMYKTQLEGYLLGEQSGQSESLKKCINENDLTFREVNKVASLEAELKEVKERFSNMSLQYAEVEAERGELVMKLKSLTHGKGWFS